MANPPPPQLSPHKKTKLRTLLPQGPRVGEPRSSFPQRPGIFPGFQARKTRDGPHPTSGPHRLSVCPFSAPLLIWLSWAVSPLNLFHVFASFLPVSSFFSLPSFRPVSFSPPSLLPLPPPSAATLQLCFSCSVLPLCLSSVFASVCPHLISVALSCTSLSRYLMCCLSFLSLSHFLLSLPSSLL